MSDQKNILFIVLDQWRADCLSASGHANVNTPNIDALAADGVLFKQHFCQSIPCGPSRASLYTGMYQHNHRSICNGTPLDARFTNIALELRKAGYDPALFGYTDTSMDPREYPANDPLMRSYERVLPGFDAQVMMDSDNLPWIADLKSKGYQFKPDELFKPELDPGEQAQKGRTFAPAFFKAEHSSAAFLCNELMKYLSVRQDAAWCAHLSIYSPHPPYIAPEPFNSSVNVADVAAVIRRPTLQQEAAQHPYLEYCLSSSDRAGDRTALTEAEVRQTRATYYGMIAEVDQQIGRLIEYLKSSGAYDNTLIVVTSDHGDQLGDHWQFGKKAYFDQSIHIPLLIRDPSPLADETRNRQLGMMTESVDVMPTVLHWLGLEIPGQCDGVSLRDIYRTGCTPDNWRTEVHVEYDFRDMGDYDQPGRGVAGLSYDECSMSIIRDEHYKYVHFNAWPALLFDLQQDPEEFNNLAVLPEYQAVVLEYAQKLLSWRMKYEDQTLSNVKLTPQGAMEFRGDTDSS